MKGRIKAKINKYMNKRIYEFKRNIGTVIMMGGNRNTSK